MIHTHVCARTHTHTRTHAHTHTHTHTCTHARTHLCVCKYTYNWAVFSNVILSLTAALHAWRQERVLDVLIDHPRIPNIPH